MTQTKTHIRRDRGMRPGNGNHEPTYCGRTGDTVGTDDHPTSGRARAHAALTICWTCDRLARADRP